MCSAGSTTARLTCAVGGPGLNTKPWVGSSAGWSGFPNESKAALGGLKRMLAPPWLKIDWKTRLWNKPKPPRMDVTPGPPGRFLRIPSFQEGDYAKPKPGPRYV